MNMEMIQRKQTAQFVCLFGKESLCLFRFLNVDLTQNQGIVCVCVCISCWKEEVVVERWRAWECAILDTVLYELSATEILRTLPEVLVSECVVGIHIFSCKWTAITVRELLQP